MAEIGTLTLTIEVDAHAFKNANNEIEKINKNISNTNTTITSTFERDSNLPLIEQTKLQIRDLQGRIKDLKTELEGLKDELSGLQSDKRSENIKEQLDLMFLAGMKAPSTDLLTKAFRALDFKNIKNNVELLFSNLQEGLIQLWLMGINSTLQNPELSEDQLQLNEETKHNIEKKLEQLKPQQEKLTEDILLAEDTLEFKIRSKNDEISGKIESIKEAETLLKDYIKRLEELTNQDQRLLEKSGEFNINDNQRLMDILKQIQNGNNKNTSDATRVNKDFIETISLRNNELQRGNQILQLTDEELLNLPGKLAMVDGAFVDATGKQQEYSKSIEDVVKNTSDGAVIFGFTKEELLGLRDATDNAAKSAENLGENGLTVTSEKAGQAGKSLVALDGNLLNVADRNKEVADMQEQVNQAVGDGSAAFDNASDSVEGYGNTLEKVENSGGFFEGIKQGFIDFVENVQSNSELMADFFADTLSQMSQSFSDLFFNVITGRFDDLKDLAKQAFEAILRAFLDLVSAIATRQIVISIGGGIGYR